MESMIIRMIPVSCVKKCSTTSLTQFSLQRYCATNPRDIMKKVKKVHPYRKIHPWKSLASFSKSLIDGVIYNKNGLVAINKPYGISGKAQKHKTPSVTGIVEDVSYSLEEAIPSIAKSLGYESLTIIKIPEKFTSGVTVLSANKKVTHDVVKALGRAQAMEIIPTTYWAVTTRVPNEIKGEKRLAMKMKSGPDGEKLPVIIESWSKNARKRGDIKILNVQFKIISHSTENLSALIQIKSSTKKWHALRMFAATALYSPILGDNVYGSRTQNVMGKWINISPFVDAAELPPKLDRELMRLLKISPDKQQLIPAHLHLREVYLPSFPTTGDNLILQAPPMPEFTWTCRQLKFKHELFKEEEEDVITEADASEPTRARAAM